MDEYGLDLHCSLLLDEFIQMVPVLEKMQDVVVTRLNNCVKEAGLYIDGVTARVKTPESLAGKLAKKGKKYTSIYDITDLLGARVITFYEDDVDKISSLIDKYFTIDWANSIDKRKGYELDCFGYKSLHYICQIPETMYSDPEHPEINKLRFEIQMRTVLQHAWATINHDIGYKTDVEIPHEYLRSILRLAGMLELADEEFSRIRTEINDYRRRVNALVENGRFGEVPLNGDSFSSYLELKPFDKLCKRIAAINQAEIIETPLNNYLEVFKLFGFNTLGDIDNMVKSCSEDAYILATHQIGRTDLDIISSSITIQNICCIHIIKSGGGITGLKNMFDTLDDPSEFNSYRAQQILDDAEAVQIGK